LADFYRRSVQLETGSILVS